VQDTGCLNELALLQRGWVRAEVSNSRDPLPRKTGTKETSISSSNAATRYCWTIAAPPPTDTSLLAAASLA